MAIKNTEAAARLPRNKHGGARRGAGRILGGKNITKKQFEDLEGAYGAKCKEAEDLQRQVDDLRFQLNYGKAFKGDSKDLLTATYKGEYFPSQEQLYSAKILLDKEYPPNVPGEYQVNEQGRVILFLPHNNRDPGLPEGDPDREWVNAQLDRQWKAERINRDEQLRKWITAGKVCEPCAILCRSQWKEADDPEWEPGHGAYTAPQQIAQVVAAQRQNGATPTDYKSVVPEKPQPERAAEPVEVPWNGKGLTVLFTEPFRRFWIGGPIEADSDGQIEVDEKDPVTIQALLTSGCRKRR